MRFSLFQIPLFLQRKAVIPNEAERNEESPHVCVITLVRILYNGTERNEASLVLALMRFLPTVGMTSYTFDKGRGIWSGFAAPNPAFTTKEGCHSEWSRAK